VLLLNDRHLDHDPAVDLFVKIHLAFEHQDRFLEEIWKQNTIGTSLDRPDCYRGEPISPIALPFDQHKDPLRKGSEDLVNMLVGVLAKILAKSN